MKKLKVMAVTGFIPNAFPANHLSVEQCKNLGDRLKNAIPENIIAFDEGWELKDCWAHKFLEDNPNLMPSDINPPKDRYKEPQHAALSNIVLLQRYEWMRLAAEKNPDVDVFAWIEYTVFKQRNVAEKVIQNFIKTLEENYYNEISLPGCWEKKPVNDSYAHWRFVGSCWVCPRQHAENVAKAVKTVATLRTELTGKISWDMNTMAYTELLEVLPIRWYPANHDETQFTNFLTMKITKEEIEKINLDKYRHLDNIDHNEFYGKPGKEHYKLLAYFSTLFSNQTIIDIGSHRGSSAVALSYNFSNKVESFDIENRIPITINSPKHISNIRFNYANLFIEADRKIWENKILNSPLIFLDIDPHEGSLEYQFYLWLKEKNYRGILIFDDIHYFANMRNNLWNKIEDSEKEDITHLGHWSGTGIIQFTKKFNFEK